MPPHAEAVCGSGTGKRVLVGRIRTIKPGFFTSDQIAAVSITARLLFIGLWTEADREGRLEYRSRQIKARLFPHDADVYVDDLVDELEAAGLVQVYADAEGDHYLAIPTWAKHQRVHPKEAPSACPTPPAFKKPGNSPARREKPGAIPSSPVGREGKEIKKEGDLGGGALAARAASPALIRSPLEREKALRFNAFVGARLEVPHKLHGDFCRTLGGDDPASVLTAWYRDVDAEIEASREPILPDVWKWLEARFKPWAQSRVTEDVLAKWVSEGVQRGA